jgi:hypothetical protein
MLCIYAFTYEDYYSLQETIAYVYLYKYRYKIHISYIDGKNVPQSLNEFKTIHLRDLMEIIRRRSSNGYEINDAEKREFPHDISIILQL